MAITLLSSPPALRYTQNPLLWRFSTDSTDPFLRIVVQILVETYTGSGEWQFVGEMSKPPIGGICEFRLNDKLRPYVSPEAPSFLDGSTAPARNICKPYKIRWSEATNTDQRATDTFYFATGAAQYFTLASVLAEGNTLRLVAETTDIAKLAAEVKLDSSDPIDLTGWVLEHDRCSLYYTVPAGVTNSNLRVPAGISIRVLRPGIAWSAYTEPRAILLGGLRREQFAKPLPPPAAPGLAAVAGLDGITLTVTDNTEGTAPHEIWVSATSGSGFSLLTTLDIGDTVHPHTPLAGGTTRYYLARAINADSQSAWSEEVSATVIDLWQISASTPENDNANIDDLATANTASALIFEINDFIEVTGLSGNISEVTMWIYLNTLTQPILDFDDDVLKQLKIEAGVWKYNGVTLTPDYFGGTLEAAKWVKVNLPLPSAIAVTKMRFGRNGTSYFYGRLAEIEATGTAGYKWLINEGVRQYVFDSLGNNLNGIISGATWSTKLSGLENGETHNGLPQLQDTNFNEYTINTMPSNDFSVASGTLPIGTSLRTFEFGLIRPSNTNIAILNYGNNTVAGQQVRLDHQGGANQFVIFASTPPNNYTLHSFAMVVGRYYQIELSLTGTTLGDFVLKVDGVIIPRTGFVGSLATVINTTDTIAKFLNATNNYLLDYVKTWNDATKTNLTNHWRNINNFENEVGANDLYWANVNTTLLKVPSDTTNDIFGQTPKNNIESPQEYWNTPCIISDTKTLNFNEGAIFVKIKGYNLATVVSQTIVDGRDADNLGLRVWINSSSRLELQHNTGDFPIASALSNNTDYVCTFWITPTNIIIRLNGVQVLNSVKSGGAISTLAQTVVGATSYGAKTNFWTNMISGVKVLDQPVTLSNIEAVEATF